MSQPIYPIQLLNDLHNHFPDVLYNPGRFRNIQDLLDYIRQVADVNPYSRGLTMYNNRQTRTTTNHRQNSTTIPSYSPVELNTTTMNPNWPPTVVTTVSLEETIPQTTRIRMPNSQNTTTLMNTLLGSMFGDILSGVGGDNGLQTFLNQRVIVHPTNEEINNASTAYRAVVHHDDICTICQDSIELNQEVRKLNHCGHYFHSECIDTWFTTNVLCPTCRHDIRDINQPPPVPVNHRRTNINNND
jgi:hypothetical protein